ncbi:MerR family transcriptional regulator [Nocardioides pacificus]
MSAQSDLENDGLLTIDELSAAVGLTVRTTRYYASLGLIPAPIRRGRVAFYDDVHRARLEMVRALQDHGFTLQAIERYMASLPANADSDELALQRAMLTSWTAQPAEELTLRQLEKKVSRRLSEADLAFLVGLRSLERTERGYRPMPNLQVNVDLLDLDIPMESMTAAGDAIARHMESLAAELTDILHTGVLAPFRREQHSSEDAAKLESTMSRLRQLTLEAVVTGFQRAANDVITRSLSRRRAAPDEAPAPTGG